jgi:biopolymer transport protein TolR
MAMQLGGGGGIKADINVTPLVDVMLVLLIIVMLVAPLVQQGVSLTLPVAANTSDHPETSDQTTVAITSDKRFWLNGSQVSESDLRQRIADALEGKKERVILIKADVEAEYGDVMKAMDELRAAGIEDMALITDPRRATPAGGGD